MLQSATSFTQHHRINNLYKRSDHLVHGKTPKLLSKLLSSCADSLVCKQVCGTVLAHRCGNFGGWWPGKPMALARVYRVYAANKVKAAFGMTSGT
jgi:hypothetical protein